jgi:hypothetical protein
MPAPYNMMSRPNSPPNAPRKRKLRVIRRNFNIDLPLFNDSLRLFEIAFLIMMME